ncbi:hypothetical protein D9V84_04210 [Bacteroidetes/Chlorobi group bacterium Naka2016]|nr:MAG: hypothetical protein D9V84_04210 [Bacteroidetes/Chlorobi group bacterium Naka2016]
MQFDTWQIAMIWFGNTPARISLTQWGSVYFENHTCCFATPSFAITYTGGGEYRALLQFDRFASHSIPPLFPLPWTTYEK